jgi:hypothetical protein
LFFSRPALGKSAPVFLLVAQICNLLYRGFVIGKLYDDLPRSKVTTPSRIQFGDTADYKSALRA